MSLGLVWPMLWVWRAESHCEARTGCGRKQDLEEEVEGCYPHIPCAGPPLSIFLRPPTVIFLPRMAPQQLMVQLKLNKKKQAERSGHGASV